MDHDGIRALVYGWYGHGNVGDESYRTSFPTLWPQLQLTFADTIQNVNQEDYDVLIVGGGNILDRNFLGSLRKFLDTGWQKPVYAFSVGSTDTTINLADLEPIQHIWVRDNSTVQRLETMGYNRVTYCPDAAFAFTPNPERGRALWRNLFRGHDLYEHKIIIATNGHLLGNQNSMARDVAHQSTMVYDLAQIVDEINSCFLFVPFSCRLPWDDRVSNGQIAAKCEWSQKVVTINQKLGAQTTIDLIAASSLIISMRYHASIFALRSCIPFIDIYHHDKNKSLLATVQYEDWGVPYWEFQASKIRSLITQHIVQQPETRTRLEQTQATLQAQLRGCITNVRFTQQHEYHNGHQQLTSE